MKKMMLTFLIIFTVSSFIFAAEKVDTITAKAVVTQQNSNKGLSKQTIVKPRHQTNWSKIKDLFM